MLIVFEGPDTTKIWNQERPCSANAYSTLLADLKLVETSTLGKRPVEPYNKVTVRHGHDFTLVGLGISQKWVQDSVLPLSFCS